jgi:GTP-binding protein HflX
LDPSSRRLRFPRDIEVIITDTVGFIRDLPKELMAAFKATLEELENADLLLHVIDISNPRYRDQINAVESILSELRLDDIPTIRVLNKMDRPDTTSL